MAGGGFFSFGKNDHGQLGLEGGESRLVPVRAGTVERGQCLGFRGCTERDRQRKREREREKTVRGI